MIALLPLLLNPFVLAAAAAAFLAFRFRATKVEPGRVAVVAEERPPDPLSISAMILEPANMQRVQTPSLGGEAVVKVVTRWRNLHGAAQRVAPVYQSKVDDGTESLWIGEAVEIPAAAGGVAGVRIVTDQVPVNLPFALFGTGARLNLLIDSPGQVRRNLGSVYWLAD